MTPPKDQDFLAFVIDQLDGVKPVHSQRMFGGVGLYQGETFFAIIDDGRLYFATDDKSRARFEACGMKPFEYAPGQFISSYYEVPVDILENDDELCAWAREAVRAQAGNRARPAPAAQQTSKRPARAKTASKRRPRGRYRR